MADTETKAPDSNPTNHNSKDVAWFTPDIQEIGQPARELLEQYSKIPPERVIPHVLEIRERAWAIHAYPCIGQLNFLDLSISLSPNYPKVLHRLTNSNATLLDLGCCFAQDIRKLVADGAPSSNLYGAELRGSYIELGYDLFLDRDTLKTKFLVADVLDKEKDALKEIDGMIDMIYTASFLHLFNWEEQVQASKRMVRLLKDEVGVLVFGRQVGTIKPGDYSGRTSEKKRFRHDEESFKRMWEEVGRVTGTEWKVVAELSDMKGEKTVKGRGTRRNDWEGTDTRRLRFECERVG